MRTTLETLQEHRRQIIAERAKATAQFDAELEKVDAAIAAIVPALPSPEPAVVYDTSSKPQTVEGQITVILEKHPGGLKMRDLTDQIRAVFGRNIKPKNVSWYLSHMRRKGTAELVGDRWRLVVKETEKNQAAE